MYTAILTAILLAAANALGPAKAHAHAGAFDFHIFGAPPVISNLIWLAIFATMFILLLFVMNRFAEERVRAEARA